MKLREAEVMIAQGHAVLEVARQLGVSKQTYYRWQQEYWGLDTTQAKKLRDLEQESGCLKNLVADLSLG